MNRQEDCLKLSKFKIGMSFKQFVPNKKYCKNNCKEKECGFYKR